MLTGLHAKDVSKTSNIISLFLFYGCLLLVCLFLLFSALELHAGGGATLVDVATKTGGLPDEAEEIKALLHYKKGIMAPLVLKGEASKWPAMALTPEKLKDLYGTGLVKTSNVIPSSEKTSSSRLLNETITLSTVIDMIEDDEFPQQIEIFEVIDKESEAAIKHAGSQETGSGGECVIGDDEDEFAIPPLFPKVVEEYFTFQRSFEKRKRRFKIATQAEPLVLQFPPQLMVFQITNKHYVKQPSSQPIKNVSHLIVQTHGQQKFILMPPDQIFTSPTLFEDYGEFRSDLVDLSVATEDELRNNSFLSNVTLHSVVLSPGDILLIPANWLVYQQALSSIPIWASFMYFLDEELRFTDYRDLLEKRLKLAETAVEQWKKEEVARHPENKLNISLAAVKIRESMCNAVREPPHISKYEIACLDLQNLQLTSLPAEIKQMGHVKYLKLGGNLLTKFPAIGMKNLEKLELSGNQLTEFFTSGMKKLEKLDLSGNQLTEFSTSGMKYLRKLDLSGNCLTEFSISDKKYMTTLSLQNNRLTTFSCCNLPCLNVVNLDQNHLGTLEEGCLSNMNSNKELTLSLDLKHNPLSEDALLHIQLDASLLNCRSIVNYPHGVKLLTQRELITQVCSRKAMDYLSFITLLKERKISPLPPPRELECAISHDLPEQVIFLKQSSAYQIYDAETLIKWFESQLPDSMWDERVSLENPMTREPIKPQYFLSPSECPLEKIYRANPVNH